MNDDLKFEIQEYIRQNLSIRVETKSSYVGDSGGFSLYQDYHVIELLLGDDVISEASISTLTN